MNGGEKNIEHFVNDMNGGGLYIVIPAYNEADNIKNVINEWYPIVEKYNGNGESRLVIVNDGSKDNTFEIINECAKTKPFLVTLTKENGGHGPAVIYGYKYAIDNKADYIFQTDSDGQTLASEFDLFWNERNDYLAILGNRSTREDGFFRIFTENTLRRILWIIFKISVPDANAPYRLMKRELVEKYIRKIPDGYNLPNVLLTTFFVYYHEQVAFLKISFKPRQAGTNSINIKKIIKIGWNAIFDFLMIKKSLK